MATFHISFKNYEDQKVNLRFIYLHIKTEKRQKIIEPGQPGIIQKKRDFSALLSSPCRHTCRTGEGLRHPECRRGWREAKGCRIMPLSDIAIPKELDDGQKKQIVLDYCQENFVDYGMIADIAFHDLDSHNPHAHVMLTLRTVSPNGFGNKQREWNNRENIEAWRVNWEIIANDRLKKYGHKSRIDSRSLKDQKEEAERKAVFAKTPKEKAKWISKLLN